jgi:alkane 1-monooxygenase
MRTSAFKYLSPLLIYAGALNSFFSTGWQVWLPLSYAWLIIPITELFIKPDATNLNTAEEELMRTDRIYDLFLYLVVIFQYVLLTIFLFSMKDQDLSLFDIIGRIWVMGLLCGTFGINVGHELGHRVNSFERGLAKALLLSSLYMHFFTEHNKGHHKRVATREDPGSARMGEMIYFFYFRSVIGSYFSAWQIANSETKKKGKPPISLHNEMVRFHIIEGIFISIIAVIFGWLILLYFIIAAIIGVLLLETVNYIEHYGLQRNKIEEDKYERAMPAHSWNSNHIIGRLMLFELSRHSDHHYMASRKYQVLRHHDDSPQMPTGYPGMMILALFPPFWFYVMNKRVRALKG